MRDMVLYGPSKYDLIWNYESVAISDMAAAQGRWGNLAVYYPKPDALVEPSVRGAQGRLGHAPSSARPRGSCATFLLSPEVQTRALEFGFRPANPDVKVVSTDPQQPVEPPEALRRPRSTCPPSPKSPSGEVTRLLLETWRRVVESR